jgi:hypothetical protein
MRHPHEHEGGSGRGISISTREGLEEASASVRGRVWKRHQHPFEGRSRWDNTPNAP